MEAFVSLLLVGMKYLLIFLIAFVIYCAWLFAINPWRMQKFYRKYSNVYVPKNLNFPEGDLKEMMTGIAQGRFTFQYLCDADAAKYDIRLGHLGKTMPFELLSPKACEEFGKLLPDKIDRCVDRSGVQFGRVFGETTALKRSTESYKRTRSIFTKLMGFNHASRFIPTIIDVLDKKLETWREGETIDGLSEMCNVALRVIVLIAFGKDINDQVEHMNYHTWDGKVIEMDFYTFFPKMLGDLLKAEHCFINNVFPFLFGNGWCYPNNINEKNIIELRTKMKAFLATLEDKDCIYRILIDEYKYHPDEIFDDLIGLLHAAHQTSHHTVCSALYYIKKRPEWFKRLKTELEEAGVTYDSNLKETLTRDVVHNAFNLSCVVKEVLRIDPAGNRSLKYRAYEDVEICGVPIPKGSSLMIAMLASHYNTEQFPDPYKFMPERFDPQSKHYMIDENTPRNPFAYIPFSFNCRKCPGMILAIIEIKTVLAYMMTKVDYEIDEKLLKDDNVRYGIFTNFKLPIKINKKL